MLDASSQTRLQLSSSTHLDSWTLFRFFKRFFGFDSRRNPPARPDSRRAAAAFPAPIRALWAVSCAVSSAIPGAFSGFLGASSSIPRPL